MSLDLRHRRRRHQDRRRRGRRGRARSSRSCGSSRPATDARRDRGGDRGSWSPSCAAATSRGGRRRRGRLHRQGRGPTVLFAPNLAWRDVDLKADLERAHRAAGRRRERRQRRGLGRVPVRRRRTTSTTCCWSRSAPASAAGSSSTASSTAAPSASPPRSATCASCPTASLCGCGNHGCFEQYGSGTALVREARAAAAAAPDRWPRPARAGRRRPRRDHRPADHRGGRRPATRSPSSSWRRSAAGWARASRRLAAVLDPGVVVIGGGVSEAGDLLLDPVRARLRRPAHRRGHRPVPEIRRGQARQRRGPDRRRGPRRLLSARCLTGQGRVSRSGG